MRFRRRRPAAPLTAAQQDAVLAHHYAAYEALTRAASADDIPFADAAEADAEIARLAAGGDGVCP